MILFILINTFNRKHLAATRDYTSITDELEGRLPNPVNEDRLDKRLPAIREPILDLMRLYLVTLIDCLIVLLIHCQIDLQSFWLIVGRIVGLRN